MEQPNDGAKASNKVSCVVGGAIVALSIAALGATTGLMVLGAMISLGEAETPSVKTSLNSNRMPSWQSFEQPEYGFQVDLPGEPKVRSRTRANGLSSKVFHVRSGDGLFMIFAQITESGGPPPKQFINELQAKAYTAGEQFLYEQFVNVPGTEACKELHFIDEFDELTMLRFVVTENAFFQVVWGGSPDNRNNPAARRFLDSFTIAE